MFMASKPHNKEDPIELEKIQRAKENMGDYPLKMGGSFIVPEHLRINAEKKRRQKILLEESMYNMKLVSVVRSFSPSPSSSSAF